MLGDVRFVLGDLLRLGVGVEDLGGGATAMRMPGPLRVKPMVVHLENGGLFAEGELLRAPDAVFVVIPLVGRELHAAVDADRGPHVVAVHGPVAQQPWVLVVVDDEAFAVERDAVIPVMRFVRARLVELLDDVLRVLVRRCKPMGYA